MNYQTQPLTMWFDRRLVLRPSSIHGIGTFAVQDIEAGALLMLVTGGLIVSPGDPQAAQLQLAIDVTRHATSTQYVALRPIQAHEEITADYYDESTLKVCTCQSPRCRWRKQES